MSRWMSNSSGCLEHPVVVARRAGDQDDARVRRDGDAVQLDVALHPPTLVVRRAVPPQALLDRVRDQRGIGRQLGSLVGVPREGDHQVADELGRGLVAGDHELDHPAGDLLAA